jgi:O-antigen/teichoic acid export membrane protein
VDGGAIRHFLWVASGKLLVLGSLFVCGVIVARAAQAPAEYALFAAGLTLVLLIDAVVGSPLDLATVRFATIHRDEPQRVDRVASAMFRTKLALGAVAIVVAAVGGGSLADHLFDSPGRVGLLLIAVGSAFALLLMRGTAVHLQIHFRFSRYAVLDATQGGLRLLLAAALLAAGVRTSESYLAAYGLTATLVFVSAVLWIPQPYLLAPWPQRADLRTMVAYVGATAGIVILGTITGRSDILFLMALGEPVNAGHYAAAAHVAGLATMVAVYASIVCQPRVVPAALSGQLRLLLRWNVIGAAAVAVLAVPSGVFLFDPLVPALFGSDFAPAVPILRILIVGTCADIFFMPVMMTLAIQLYPRASLGCETLITIAFLVAAPYAAGHGPMAMAILATLVRLAKFVVYTGITWRQVRRRPEFTAPVA